VASKGLRPLHRRRGGAIAHGCGRSGRGALPLPRAAVISTGLRVHAALGVGLERHATQQGRRLTLAPPRLAACRQVDRQGPHESGFRELELSKAQLRASRACETSLVLPPCAHRTAAVLILTLAASVAGAHEYHSKTPARTWLGLGLG